MKETEIRPKELFRQYLKLCEEDARTYFNAGRMVDIPCPACGGANRTEQFVKVGFKYVTCDDCDSLYQSPRPPLEDFGKYYKDSPSSNFWAKEFFPVVEDARREKLFLPKLERVKNICKQRNIHTDTVLEVGAGNGMFLKEFGKVFPDSKLSAIEPGLSFAMECRKKGVEVYEDVVENVDSLSEKPDLVVTFEVIEHIHNPATFLASVSRLMKPGSSIIITGLCGDGFDIQLLWEKSKAVLPPLHINFLSVKGLEALFSDSGFADVDIQTPGQLDSDIVKNAIADDVSLKLSKFESLLMSKDDEVLAEFQSFLAKNRLSSHVWIVARKI